MNRTSREGPSPPDLHPVVLGWLWALNREPVWAWDAPGVGVNLSEMRLTKAAELVENEIEETLSCMRFPSEHWRCLRTNNPLERLNREVRRRMRVVGAFPDGQSALMLVSARLRHVAGTKWGLRRYMDMKKLAEQKQERTTAQEQLNELPAVA